MSECNGERYHDLVVRCSHLLLWVCTPNCTALRLCDRAHILDWTVLTCNTTACKPNDSWSFLLDDYEFIDLFKFPEFVNLVDWLIFDYRTRLPQGSHPKESKIKKISTTNSAVFHNLQRTVVERKVTKHALAGFFLVGTELKNYV